MQPFFAECKGDCVWVKYVETTALHTGDCLAVSLHRTLHRNRRKKMKQNVTYMLECSDKTLYTGWTNNIEKRLEAHNSGQGAKYTRGRLPVKLVYLEVHDTKQEAMQREAFIKRLSRAQKQALIQQYTATSKELSS